MARQRRFERFDPITVRAAARMVQYRRLGRLECWELRYYLSELTELARHSAPDSFQRLGRIALRMATLGQSGIPAPCSLQRRPRALPKSMRLLRSPSV
jgi:hypothetical protein